MCLCVYACTKNKIYTPKKKREEEEETKLQNTWTRIAYNMF